MLWKGNSAMEILKKKGGKKGVLRRRRRVQRREVPGRESRVRGGALRFGSFRWDRSSVREGCKRGEGIRRGRGGGIVKKGKGKRGNNGVFFLI